MRLDSYLSMAAAAVLAACGSVDNASPDASVDAPVVPTDTPAMCDPAGTFGEPTRVLGIADGIWFTARLSPDELTLYTSGTQPNETHNDLFVTSRRSRSEPFGQLTRLMATSSVPSNAGPGNDNFPSVSADGLAIVFDSDRTGGRFLNLATRISTLNDFGGASPVGGIAAAGGEQDVDPFFTADGQELWFASLRTPRLGSTTQPEIDLWRATKSGTGFANPVPEQGLSSTATDGQPILSADRLAIYFTSNRTGTGSAGGFDIWTSRRTTVNDGFPAPTPVMELNKGGTDFPSWLSPDRCRLYMVSDRDTGLKIFVAERQP